MKLLLNTIMALALIAPALSWAQVDINTADAAQLAEELKGIGKSKAEAIVTYRQANGPFKDADELVNVKGIGLATVNNNRDLIQVSPTGGKTSATAKPKPGKE